LRLESEGDERLDFAIETLELSPRLGRMARTLTLPGHGHLEIEDAPQLDEWVPRTSRVEAWADWLERRRTAALTSALLTVVGVVLFFQVGLPWMANRLAPAIPPPMERVITRQAMALLDRLHLEPTKLPAERRAGLQAKFAALVAGLPREADFRLEFRNAPKIGPNAFALPDGLVVVTDQLVTLVEADEELLAVLAHEAGHHEHRHGMRQALQSSAVVVVAGFLFGDLSGTGSLSVSIPVILLESGFSRDHEREADAFAFRLLKERGMSPAEFGKVMARLSRHYGESSSSGAVSYLSTHPASAERIEAANRAAEEAGDDAGE
jgi:Zn-dependent protease with chaperone function